MERQLLCLLVEQARDNMFNSELAWWSRVKIDDNGFVRSRKAHRECKDFVLSRNIDASVLHVKNHALYAAYPGLHGLIIGFLGRQKPVAKGEASGKTSSTVHSLEGLPDSAQVAGCHVSDLAGLDTQDKLDTGLG